ncbi:unnamed protein product, partial [Symbiodinium sp. KB8]
MLGELENVVHRTGSKDVEKAPKDVNPAGSAKDLEVAKRALTAPLLITGSQYPLRSDLSDAGTVEEVSQQQIKSMLADAAHILQQDPWATLSTDPVIQRESLLAVQDLLLWSISS